MDWEKSRPSESGTVLTVNRFTITVRVDGDLNLTVAEGTMEGAPLNAAQRVKARLVPNTTLTCVVEGDTAVEVVTSEQIEAGHAAELDAQRRVETFTGLLTNQVRLVIIGSARRHFAGTVDEVRDALFYYLGFRWVGIGTVDKSYGFTIRILSPAVKFRRRGEEHEQYWTIGGAVTDMDMVDGRLQVTLTVWHFGPTTATY